MKALKQLFQQAWAAVSNPGHEERVAAILDAIRRELPAKKANFNLEEMLEPIDCTDKDVKVATQCYYEKLLKRYWSAGVLGENHQKALAFAARKLDISAEAVSKMNLNAALTYFGAKLGSVLEDGVVTDEEFDELSRVAATVDLSVPALVRRHVAAQSIHLLRGLFAKAVSTGVLSPATWDNLTSSATRLGLSQRDFMLASRPLAQSFAEHVLADAKSDGVISQQEHKYLRWLMESFEFPLDFNRYVNEQIELVRERARIASGNLEALSVPDGINLEAGELLFALRRSTLRIAKRRKTGLDWHDHEGLLFLTDNRLLFDSPTKAMRVSYRSLISWSASDNSIQLSVVNKPEMIFTWPMQPEPLLAEKFTALVRLHNQSLQRVVEGTVDRHIPRNVRQRVWQKYGGKCADCGATDYLEFDHIVPVAKGGSNSDQNIQLLCRKCNLSKSDLI